nr:calcium/sodium antiporter [Saprospiraceae bacterium]
MAIPIIFLVIGFALLIKGADWLVEGGSSLAKRFRISDLAIGLTVVAFGTSVPELVVNVLASWQGFSDIVFGNVIGSNLFNLFAILGIAGLISPLLIRSGTVWREIPLSFLAALLLFFLVNSFFFGRDTGLSRTDGLLLLLLFSLFIFYVYKQLKTEGTPDLIQHKGMSVLKTWGFIIIGLLFLVIGGRLVVVYAVEIAESWGISETVIGLTIVAAGTSLPELATSVVAAFKKNNDIAVGNIIGSNIFNIFLILGVSSLIRPLNYTVSFNRELSLLMLGTIALLIALFIGKKYTLDRWKAGIFLAVYAGYTLYLIN